MRFCTYLCERKTVIPVVQGDCLAPWLMTARAHDRRMRGNVLDVAEVLHTC
jgi:hypothetical protein